MNDNPLNHADAERIATILEQVASISVGTNDLNTTKLPSHSDGERIITALSALKNNNALNAKYTFNSVDEMQAAIQAGEVKNNATIYVLDTIVVQAPIVDIGTYTYDGTAQGPTITGLETEHCTVTNATQTDAGTYILTIALKDTNTMKWDDSTTAPKTYEYTINKVIVEVPTVSETSKTYNREAQHPNVVGYDSTIMTRTGYEYTNAGNYTLSFDLIDSDNYEWNNNTTSFAWSIAPKSVTIPTVSGSFVYSGSSNSATIGNTTDSEYYTQSGTSSATDIGSYTVTFTLNDTVNTKWADNSTTQKSGTWSITAKTVAIPTVSGSFTYNGSTKNAAIGNTGDSAYYTQSGTVSAVNANTYTVTFTLKDTSITTWSDGTTAPKSATWVINKAAQSLTASTTSITLNNNTLSATSTISGNINSLSVSSGYNTSVVSASLSGNTVTFDNVNKTKGNTSVTITAAASNNYYAGSVTIYITASFVKMVSFQDGTDAEIADMLDAYYNNDITWADMGWNVGDTRQFYFKSMKAANPNSSTTWEEQYITIVIVAHDHTKLATSINGHDKACITVQTREFLYGRTIDTAHYPVYVNGDASKDNTFTKWSNSYLRTYLNNTVLGAIPAGRFKSAIKSSQHYRHTTYNGTSSELVTDMLFLPSYPEVFGTTSYSNYVNTSPNAEGTQFAYYSSAGNRKKESNYVYNNIGYPNGFAEMWWISSPCALSIGGEYYWLACDNGSCSYTNGEGSARLAPAWAM